jgi:predicted ATP-dependent serine protease
VTQAERRLEECKKLGCSTVLVPTGTSAASKGVIVEAETVQQALAGALETS